MTSEPLALLTPNQNNGKEESQFRRSRPYSNFARTLGFKVQTKYGVILAIDSTECFVLPSSQLNLSQFKTTETLAIALEEHLPLDAEDMVMGIVSPRSKNTLTIVSERSPLIAEVERLESDQHWIAAVSCTSLLATQELTYNSLVPSSFDCLWKNHRGGWDLVHVRKSKPISWQWSDESDFMAMTCMDSTNIDTKDESTSVGSIPLFVEGELSENLIGSLRESRETVLFAQEAKQIEFATRMAARIVRASATPWLNLAGKRLPTREPWAPIRIPLLILLVLVCVGLVAFQGTLLWRSLSLTASATESDDEQIAAFRTLYPGQKIPTDIVGLLRSEQRRLQSSEEEMQKEPPIYSALPVLSLFLNSLPHDAEFRIDRVRAQSNQIISAEGATRTLEDFQLLIGSIRQAGFDFQQPNVVNMADGFTVRLEKLTRKP